MRISASTAYRVGSVGTASGAAIQWVFHRPATQFPSPKSEPSFRRLRPLADQPNWVGQPEKSWDMPAVSAGDAPSAGVDVPEASRGPDSSRPGAGWLGTLPETASVAATGEGADG